MNAAGNREQQVAEALAVFLARKEEQRIIRNNRAAILESCEGIWYMPVGRRVSTRAALLFRQDGKCAACREPIESWDNAREVGSYKTEIWCRACFRRAFEPAVGGPVQQNRVQSWPTLMVLAGVFATLLAISMVFHL